MRELTPELRAVYDLAQAAQGTHEAGELLQRICASVGEAFGFGRVGISRYLADEDEIEVVATHGIDLATLREIPRAVEDWPYVRRALETRELVFVEDLHDEGPAAAKVARELGVRSTFVLPLISVDRCLGFLSADRGGEPFRLDPEGRGVLTVIGTLAASFLEKALVHEELLQLDRLKSNFIALASHELRAPAAVVYGISSTLHLRGHELTDGQLEQLRRALFEQSTRLQQLVDQLLDLSRLEAKAIRIRPERLAVRLRVEELVSAIAPSGAAEVELEVPADLQAVADSNAFDRIVSNLLTNALSYGAPPVTISAVQNDRHFRLAVEDRGRGVEPAFVPRLFERFTRSNESRERQREGAGLGLSIAQSYAEAHGGEIVYRPVHPHGARFELVLPTQTYPIE